MSKMYNNIKKWYDHGLWTKAQVANAVAKHQITPEEYTLITGDPYEV